MHRSAFTSILALSAASAVVFAAAKDQGGGSAPEVPPAPPAPPAAPAAVASKTTPISTEFKLPTKKGSGGPSPYDFDGLAAPTVNEKGETVHASFGVVGRTKKNMNSTLHTANKNYREMLKNPDGTPKMVPGTGRQKGQMVQAFNELRKFEAFDVKEDGGVTVRVFRTK